MIIIPPDALIVHSGTMGYWSIRAIAHDGSGWKSIDITSFRNAVTEINDLSYTDPFGPNTSNLRFPAVNAMEKFPGTDTWWIRAGTQVEITYTIINPETAAVAKRFRNYQQAPTDPDAVEEAARSSAELYSRKYREFRSMGEYQRAELAAQAEERLIKLAEAARAKYEAGEPIITASIIWEGFMGSRNWVIQEKDASLVISCIGAMRILDNRVAQQIAFSQPMPYEWVIARHFIHAEQLHPTGLAPMKMEWPEWWEKRYMYNPDVPAYLLPGYVVDGMNWTGMTTRDFGRWDAVLSSYIQGLLSVMFTEKGQFTLMLDQGRVPVLRHRDHLFAEAQDTFVVDAAQPGVEVDLNEDETMTANAVYGYARSQYSGTAYTGLHYSTDGSSSYYDTFEEHAAVSPYSPTRDLSLMRKELYITFSDGMYPGEAIEKARGHIMRVSSTGLVGSIRLKGIDPMVRDQDGEMVPFPSDAIKAGDTIRVKGLFGTEQGRVFTIAKSDSSPMSRELNLTVDSKFRDYMTVREIMDRGRDALRPWHTMTVGGYSVNIPDPLLPWNYGEGSGYIPYESLPLWTGAPQWLAFPWEEWTRQHPPSHASYAGCYLRVPALTNDPATNMAATGTGWNRVEASTEDTNCYVLLAQAGEIALLQIAAYDINGNVKRVPFHVSIWHSNAASSGSTPYLHTMNYDVEPPVDESYWSTYTDGDGILKQQQWPDGGRYPFYEGAWEQINTDGTQNEWMNDTQPAEDGLIVGYGNYWEKAGYFPNTGRSDSDDMSYPDPDVQMAAPTGMLVDETGWSFNFTNYNQFNLNDPSANSLTEHANATVLIFCESETDTYFLGRLFKKEYGA